MSNTKDTPMDYKPLITIAMQEYADKQNASLKLELQKQKEDIKSIDNPDHHIKVLKERLVELESQYQKQKELNAELVKEIESYQTVNGTGFWTDKLASLIKKSSEI